MKLAARGFFSLVDCYYNKSFRKRIVRLNLILFSFIHLCLWIRMSNEQNTFIAHFFFIPTLLTLLVTILTAASASTASCGVPSLCTVHPQICCFFLAKLISSPVIIIAGGNLRTALIGSQYRCYEALIPIFQCPTYEICLKLLRQPH